MRKTLIASAVFFLIFFYGLILSQTRVNIIDDQLEPKNAAGFYDYRGISNVHTDRGLGSGSALDVIKAAQESNLDYLFITDLNQFTEPFAGAASSALMPELQPKLKDSYHRKTLVMTANEYGYLDSRLLLYDIKKQHELDGPGQAQVLLADLLSQPGDAAKDDVIVLAHPTKPGFAWNGPYPAGLDGIEVVNLKTAWRKAWDTQKWSFFWSALVYPFNSELSLIRLYDESTEELELWDHLSASRHTIGMGGSEATAKTASMGNWTLKFPSYQTSFNMLSNHVLLRTELTGEAASDRKKLLGAISSGAMYISLDVLGNPKGFTTAMTEGDHVHMLGSQVKLKPGLKMQTHLPSIPSVPYEIALIKDGQHVASVTKQDVDFDIKERGVYRVVVRVFVGFTLPDGMRWITWIYTNPIYVN